MTNKLQIAQTLAKLIAVTCVEKSVEKTIASTTELDQNGIPVRVASTFLAGLATTPFLPAIDRAVEHGLIWLSARKAEFATEK